MPAVQPLAKAAPVATQTDEEISAALERAVATAAPFDDSAVAQATSDIPPFPYVAYPPTVGAAFQRTNVLPMDEVYVVIGGMLHRLEGRIAVRDFDHADAQMSGLEVQRYYDSALRAFGAVKVAATRPVYPVDFRIAKLRVPQRDMSYDVYLARVGAARHWTIVMTDAGSTRLLTIEESPFVQTLGDEGAPDTPVTATGAPPLAPQPLDIAALPVHSATLPPFPYLAYPAAIARTFYHGPHANLDMVSFIVGNALRTVEGKVEARGFYNADAGLSLMAARRNYEAVVKGLGAVRVSAVPATDAALIAANGQDYDLRKKLHIPEQRMSYDAYLLRTPGKNIWMALMFSHEQTAFITAEEKAMQ